MTRIPILLILFLIEISSFAQSPELVSDINTNQVQETVDHFTRFGNLLVFLYKEANRSSKLISYDERADEFNVIMDLDSVKEIYKVQNISSTSEFIYITTAHQKFVGHNLPDGAYYHIVWASNGRHSGTYKVFGFNDATLSQIVDTQVINDRLFFRAKESSLDKSNLLWTSDGTVKGTVPTKTQFNDTIFQANHFPIQVAKNTYLVDPKNKRMWKTNSHFNKTRKIEYFLESDFDGSVTLNNGLVYSTFSKNDLACRAFCEGNYSLWFCDERSRKSEHQIDFRRKRQLVSLDRLGNGVMITGGDEFNFGKQKLQYFDFGNKTLEKVDLQRNSKYDWAIVDNKFYSSHIKYKDSIKYLYSFDSKTKDICVIDSFNIKNENVSWLSNSELYFMISDNNCSVLGYYDVKENQLTKISSLTEQNASSIPMDFISSRNRLFFTSYIGNKKELFMSDGTDDGTKPIETQLKHPESIAVVNNHLIFKEYSTNELFSYSLIDQSIIKLPVIDSTHRSNGYPDNWTNGKTKVFFTSVDASKRYVWQTDGTIEGTRKIFEFLPHREFMELEHFNTTGDTLYFTEKLRNWKSSRLFKVGINGDSSKSYSFKTSGKFYIWQKVVYQDKIFYHASSLNENGIYELSQSNGNNRVSWADKIHFINHIFATDSLMYIVGRDNRNRRELWVFDGTKLQMIRTLTEMVTDVRDVPEVGNFNYSQGSLYFTIQENKTTQTSIWISKGDSVSTQKILTYDDYRKYETEPIFSSIGWYEPDILRAVSFKEKLYFNLYQPDTGKELWKTDGTIEGTNILMDINPGVKGSNPEYFQIIGENLFFSANDGRRGTELWRVSLSKD